VRGHSQEGVRSTLARINAMSCRQAGVKGLALEAPFPLE